LSKINAVADTLEPNWNLRGTGRKADFALKDYRAHETGAGNCWTGLDSASEMGGESVKILREKIENDRNVAENVENNEI
jgi:hypothetical protein